MIGNFGPQTILAVATILHWIAPTVNSICVESACTSACRYATKDENAIGHCDLNYVNPGFGKDSSCVCGQSCLPRVYLETIMRPNAQVACVGGRHQTQCSACPTSTLEQRFVPHSCTAAVPDQLAYASTGAAQTTQMCMCMCVGPDAPAYTQPVSHESYNPYSYNPYTSSYNPFFYGKK